MKVTDSIRQDKTIVFHSTRSSEDFGNTLLRGQARFGKEGGAMLGPGFYANQYLVQAQRGNYGKYILKAQVYGIKNYFFCELRPYKDYFGTTFNTRQELIESECARFGVSTSIGYPQDGVSSANWLSRYYTEIKKSKASGLVYYGDWDKASIVSWNPKRDIRALEYTSDKGTTWTHYEINASMSSDKRQNLNSSEVIRSTQRAKDLAARYETKTEEQRLRAVVNQIKSAHRTPAKFEARKYAMLLQFPELKSQIEKELNK